MRLRFAGYKNVAYAGMLQASKERGKQAKEWRVEGEGLNVGDACQKIRFITLKENKPGMAQALIDP